MRGAIVFDASHATFAIVDRRATLAIVDRRLFYQHCRQNVAPYQHSNPKAEPISTLLLVVAFSAETPLPIC